jgi:hypothetical protein
MRMSKTLGTYAVSAVVATLVASCTTQPRTVTPPPGAVDVVLDEFRTDTGFTTAVTGDAALVSYEVKNGVLVLHHKPRALHNAISVSKTYRYDLSKPTWFSFRFKMGEILLGQDMYSTIKFGQRDDLGITIGINSEQHWNCNYFIGGTPNPCDAKRADDEFFISVSPKIFPKATDDRLHYPTGHKKRYDEWTIFAVKWDPPEHGARGLISFYVDGKKVDVLRPLDDPQRVIDTHTDALAGLGVVDITFSMTLLIDGDDHGYPGNKYGVRGRGCYLKESPGIPTPVRYPAAFAGNDGQALKRPWMKNFDAVACVVLQALRAQQPWVRAYENPRSAMSPMEVSGGGHPATLYANLTVAAATAALRQGISAALWPAIQAGHIDLETAILMGALELPPAEHGAWQRHPPGTHARIAQKLAELKAQAGAGSLAKCWVLEQVRSAGYAVEATHLGYLLPEDMVQYGLVRALRSDERAGLTAPSQPRAAHFYWDWFKISRNP